MCPRLRRLDLTGTTSDELARPLPGETVVPIGPSLAQALASRALSQLQYMGLSKTNLGQGGMAAIASVLKGGMCPELMILHASSCDLGIEDGQALGRAIEGGGFTKLEELILANNPRMGDQGKLLCLL